MIDVNQFLPLCPKLRRYALRLTRNWADSEDLLQDTLERALDRQDQYRGEREGSMFQWLRSIMFSRFISSRHRTTYVHSGRHEGPRKASYARQRVAREEPMPEGANELIAPYPCRAKHYASLWDMERALEQLPRAQYDAIYLNRIEGLDYQAVADHQGVAIGTVKSRIHRAEAALALACDVS